MRQIIKGQSLLIGMTLVATLDLWNEAFATEAAQQSAQKNQTIIKCGPLTKSEQDDLDALKDITLEISTIKNRLDEVLEKNPAPLQDGYTPTNHQYKRLIILQAGYVASTKKKNAVLMSFLANYPYSTKNTIATQAFNTVIEKDPELDSLKLNADNKQLPFSRKLQNFIYLRLGELKGFVDALDALGTTEGLPWVGTKAGGTLGVTKDQFDNVIRTLRSVDFERCNRTVPTGTPPDAPTGTPPDAPTGTPPDAPTGTPPDASTGNPTNPEGDSSIGGGVSTVRKEGDVCQVKDSKGQPILDSNNNPVMGKLRKKLTTQ